LFTGSDVAGAAGAIGATGVAQSCPLDSTNWLMMLNVTPEYIQGKKQNNTGKLKQTVTDVTPEYIQRKTILERENAVF